jgi:hypothetical protein
MGSLRIIDLLMILDHLDRLDPLIHHVNLVLKHTLLTVYLIRSDHFLYYSKWNAFKECHWSPIVP